MFLIYIKYTYILLCYNQYKDKSHKVERKCGKLKKSQEKWIEGSWKDKVIKSCVQRHGVM